MTCVIGRIVPSEIEITPEMIEAGIDAYAGEAGHDPSDKELEAAIKAAFVAMLRASPLCRS